MLTQVGYASLSFVQKTDFQAHYLHWKLFSFCVALFRKNKNIEFFRGGGGTEETQKKFFSRVRRTREFWPAFSASKQVQTYPSVFRAENTKICKNVERRKSVSEVVGDRGGAGLLF